MKKLQPEKVKKVFCPKCGELQIKIYPWSSIGLNAGQLIPPCKKCINKSNSTLSSGVAQ